VYLHGACVVAHPPGEPQGSSQSINVGTISNSLDAAPDMPALRIVQTGITRLCASRGRLL
jgi:hypothetical protein